MGQESTGYLVHTERKRQQKTPLHHWVCTHKMSEWCFGARMKALFGFIFSAFSISWNCFSISRIKASLFLTWNYFFPTTQIFHARTTHYISIPCTYLCHFSLPACPVCSLAAWSRYSWHRCPAHRTRGEGTPSALSSLCLAGRGSLCWARTWKYFCG